MRLILLNIGKTNKSTLNSFDQKRMIKVSKETKRKARQVRSGQERRIESRQIFQNLSILKNLEKPSLVRNKVE